MQFKRFKTPGIAHNAYIIGSCGIGILVDPRRDVEEYLSFAAEKGISIQYVFQTHRQEDFVIGSSAIKRALGATVVAGAHPLSYSADRQLADGESMEIGELKIMALYTPGHTPESTSYAVSLRRNPKQVWAVFTGDSLFIGETGRTDLPDRNKTAENAGILYDGIHAKILPLGDGALIFPAHGAGSVCGGTIADYDESTIGFERTYNKVFTLSREDFVAHKLRERIPRPPYFVLMERLNVEGGSEMPPNWGVIPLLLPQKFREKSASGLVIDTREVESYAAGHIPGSHSVWLDGLPVFGGWVAPDNRPVYLVVEQEKDVKTALLHLARIGNDNVKGVLAGGFHAWRDAGLPIDISGTIAPTALSQNGMPVLDVRDITEYEDGHISRASHAYVGYIPDHIPNVAKKFPKDEPLVVVCSVGHRASLAASMLRLYGYTSVFNMLGGMTAWEKLQLPQVGGSSEIPLDELSIEKDFPHQGKTT